ncbi:MAG: oligosaccharide flippase family protein [Dermatophilaceae bacterium]
MTLGVPPQEGDLANSSVSHEDRSTARLRGLARGSAVNLLGAAVMALCVFGTTVAVTRGLSKTQAGIFFSVTSLFLLATAVGQLGTNTALVYFLSRARALGRAHVIPAYVRTATLPVMLCAGAMTCAFFAFAPQLAALTNPHNVAAATSYLRVLAIFIPMAALESVALAGTRGLGTMRPNAVVEQLGRPVLQLLLVVGAVWMSQVRLLGLAWGLAYLPAAIAAAIWLRSLIRRFAAPADPRDNAVGVEFWRFSAPRALASVAQVAMQRFDIILVGALSGPVQAAIYAAATRFLVVGQMGNRAISMAVQPRLGQALATSDHHAASHLYRVSTAWLISLTWPLYLTFLVFGSQLMHIFGRGYNAGSDVLLILSCSMLLSTGCGMVDIVLTMAGRASWNLLNVLTALGVNIGLDLWLIPKYGIQGAAIGWAVGIIVQNLVPLSQIALTLRLHPFGRSTAAAAFVSLISFGAVPLAGRTIFGTGWPSMAFALGSAAVCQLIGLWVFRNVIELANLRLFGSTAKKTL